MTNFTEVMSNYKFIKDYSRWIDSKDRYETWEEAVARVMDMHRKKYNDKMSDELESYISEAQEGYNNKFALGSQRNLQFGGEPTLRKEGRTYNCLTSYCDRPKFFQEAMWWLLLGGGVGFSVQKHHISKLPNISMVPEDAEDVIFTVPDSIEGWSDSFGVLLSQFLDSDSPLNEYQGKNVVFDFSQVRPEGSMISGGFKAPGANGLKSSLEKAKKVIESRLDNNEDKLHPIDAYDIVMHMSDAVLSGGVRRSATICLFSPDDNEMVTAKTGNWFNENPQRGRSNNSALLVRGDTDYETYSDLFESIRQFGEPGIVWAESTEVMYNPCVEIGFMPIAPNGKSAWQGCNLTECNGGKMKDMESAIKAVRTASILGTLQAGYTDFKYTDKDTKDTFERESLLGVSITGWMENPDFLFDENVQRELALVAVEVNKEVSKLIGINQAARVTCTKPSGNASVILGTSSGIHPHHSKRYIRNMQANKNEDIVKTFTEVNPDAVEESVWSATGRDVILSFPIESPDGSKYRRDLIGTRLLDYVKSAQNNWVEYGTNDDLCTDSRLRHNISNTIPVDDWDEIKSYVWDNKDHFAGISFISMSGDKDYPQAPFTEVKTAKEIVSEYGESSLMASGLIVDALNSFNDDLWAACSVALGLDLNEVKQLAHATSKNALKRDWLRRFDQFADRYLSGDKQKLSYLLKDVHLLHKWERLTRTMSDIDWENADLKPEFVDVNTTGAVACAGGVCDISL